MYTAVASRAARYARGMRYRWISGAAIAACALASFIACGGTTSTSSGGVSDASADGASSDGASTDGASTDGASVDAGGDGSDTQCTLLGGTYDKTCGTAADCTTVARGCYCGAQPVIGIAKSAAAAAQACEAKAGRDCALGCANFPGQVAEDGQNNVDGGTIDVACDGNQCKTFLR